MSVSPSFRIKSGVQDGCAALRVGDPPPTYGPDSLPPLTAAPAGSCMRNPFSKERRQ